MTPADRQYFSDVSMRMGMVLFGLSLAYGGMRALTNLQVTTTQGVHDAVVGVEKATDEVQKALLLMAAETSRAQRLAVWVGVATAILGAILGGFAGAYAAQLIG